ncbi:MAG TPA: two pore domain potassium channel family protein [Parvularcula sp.]|nr:two pore domain potassium channel family protein [Parvularcula sp.]
MNAPETFTDELLISGGMMAATVFFHAIIITASSVIMRTAGQRLWGPVRFIRDTLVLSAASFILLAAHSAEAAAWAFVMIKIGAFGAFEEAFYFASVAFTTLGFGDVLLPPGWRLLAGAIAADGFILFGMSAAFLFEAVRKARIGDPT